MNRVSFVRFFFVLSLLPACESMESAFFNVADDLDAQGKKDIQIHELFLVDGASQTVLGPLTDGAELDLEQLGEEIVVRADVSADTQSVEFIFGSENIVDNTHPFEMTMHAVPGSHSLTAVAYMKSDRRGTSHSKSVTFRIIESVIPEDPVPEDPVPEDPVPEDPVPEDPVPTACPEELKNQFKNYATSFKDDLLRQSLSGDASQYYSTSYYIQAMLSGLEATHDPEVTAWVAQSMTNLMASADKNNQWQPLYSYGLGQQLGSWQMQSAMARFAAYIKKKSPLRSTYNTLADQVIQFLYTATFKPWYEDMYGFKIPYVEVSPTQWWNDKATHLITMAINLYVATQNEPEVSIGGKMIGADYYKKIASRGVQAFKSTRLTLRGDAWVWDEGNWIVDRDPGDENAPDTSHANREAMMTVLAHEAGLVITKEDVERMANTFSNVIWNGSSSSPLFTNYINGSNSTYRGEGAWTNGTIYMGFALTGRYTKSALDAVEAIMSAVNRGEGQLGRNSSTYGKISLAGHQLRNVCAAK